MSIDGLAAQAEALGRLLGPLCESAPSRAHAASTIEDLAWGATAVLSRLLATSRPTISPVRRDEAAALITQATDGRVSLASLESKGWIRWVLGELEIPQGIGVALADPRRNSTQNAVSDDEFRALSSLRDRIFARHDRSVQISKIDACRILAQHHGAPSGLELTRAGALQDHGDFYELCTDADLWRRLGPRIAARLWTSVEISHDLDRWLEIVPGEWWIGAAEHLPPENRPRLLDSMLAKLESERDLKDWHEELGHIALDSSSYDSPIRKIEPPGPTALARYRWWQELKGFGGHSRARISCLINAIVYSDAAEGQAPLARIRRLLVLSETMAWLGFAVPDAILHRRPDAITGLATDVHSGSLAMVLLNELDIPWSSMDIAEKALVHQERYRTALWRELLPLFIAGLARATGAYDTQAAGTLIELVTHLQGSIRNPILIAPSHQRVLVEAARDRMKLLDDELRGARVSYKARTNNPRYLPQLAPSLLDAALALPVHDLWQSDRFDILFWVLEHTSREENNEAHVRCAESIARSFADWLNEEIRNGAVRSWSWEHAELADLPWHRVFSASQRALDVVLDACRFRARFDRIGGLVDQLSAERQRFAKHELVSTLLRKMRLAVTILVSAIEHLSDEESPSAGSSALLARLREHLCELLGEEPHAPASIFSGHPYIMAPPDSLLSSVVAVVERMPLDLEDRCVRDWLTHVNDPLVILGLLGMACSTNIRSIARTKYEPLEWDQIIKRQIFLPTLLALSRFAVSANELPLAETILSQDRSRSADVWIAQAFLPKLMLAAARHDPSAIDAVELPRDHEAAQAARTFYRALAQIESAPDDAAAGFERLVSEGHDIGASGVNLFAARLQLAGAITDPDRRRAAHDAALKEWSRIAARLGTRDLERIIAQANYNELYALRESGRDAEFMARWDRLRPNQRASQRLVQLAVERANCRKEGSTAKALLEHAATFHGSPEPDWLRSLRSAVEANEAAPTVASPQSISVSQLSDRDLRDVHSEALRRPITSRALILGSYPDGDIARFVLDQHLTAARDLQRTEGMWAQLREEDKYSDIMVMQLRHLFSKYNATVHPQDRGGRSGSDSRKTDRGGVGERDWTIEADGAEIAIAEALVLPAADQRIHDHLTKLLERYDRSGLAHSLMVLYVTSPDLKSISDGYVEVMSRWRGAESSLASPLKPLRSPVAHIKVFESTLRRDEEQTTTVFHILIRVAVAS